jgi:hypothetical protein
MVDVNGNRQDMGAYTVLLSPQGVQTDPVPIPEPGSLIVLAFLSTGYGILRFQSKSVS